MIYVPTLTSNLREEDSQRDCILYSPNKKHPEIIKAKKITIWDNYTYYLMKFLRNKEKAIEHYKYVFIKNYLKIL